MAKNADLNKAAKAKKDEFYTQLTDIEKEMRYYRDFFRGKSVLCNCDDPFESNFFKYFAMNFNSLRLKKLIATCYATSPVAGKEFEYYIDQNGQLSFDKRSDDAVSITRESARKPYKIEITEVTDANGDGRVDLSDVEYLLKNRKNELTLLDGDGDFRSQECIDLMKQADVVVTNPPFSLFRAFVAQLVKYEKHFLIIGNINAVTYKEVFPLIMQNRIWLGASIHSGDREFRVPDSYPLNASGCRIDENGTKYIRVKGVRWFTNIDYAARHEDLVLYKHYTPEEYPHYDNYDAIEVSKTADIPCDYYEEMGVPITYLDKHNPDQFDIVGSSRDLGRPMSEIAPKGSYETGGPRFYLSVDCSQSVNVERERETEKRAERSATAGFTTESLSDARCNGIMGVPITFLDKFNPDQFEIVGATESEGKGFSAGLWNADSGIAQPIVCGERKYKRLFIKRK